MKTLRKTAVNICRFLTAVTFILSGFVKAVDPIGTQYKIQDYLEGWQIAQYVPDFISLTVSVLLSAIEFSIGVMLLLALRRHFVTRLLLLIMLVMTPFTFWIAYSNPVSDCGCFGDAIKLTNWETFGKNVVLLACAVVVSRWRNDMVKIPNRNTEWLVANYTPLFSLAISGLSLYYLPMFDFRQYHIGADIRKGMEIPEGAEQPQFVTTFILEKNGERKEFTLDEYPDSTWTFIDSKTVQISEGYIPPIHDFSIMSKTDGEDITDSIIGHRGYTFLLIAPYLEQADDSQFDDINEVYDYATEHGYPFYCLTASSTRGVERWKDFTGAEYPFCTMDATTLQTIIRSNPGLVLLHDGVVIGKWSHNNLPADEELGKPLDKAEIGQMPDDSSINRILFIIGWFIVPLGVLILVDGVCAWIAWVRKKEESNKIYQLFKKKKKNEKENCSRKLEDEHESPERRGSGKGAERSTDG